MMPGISAQFSTLSLSFISLIIVLPGEVQDGCGYCGSVNGSCNIGRKAGIV